MYTEEPRREINWGNLIKKGLLILIAAVAIFLIIWLVTRNNSNGVNVNYDDNNTVETNKNPNSNTYSEIFINNYRYFHDTAKEYFLISNLPEKGKTLKFTLQELIDKKLVLPFSYTDKEVCDTEASYVSVKNTDGKYEMTTNLVCGKEVAKTVEELGCNQICVDKICSCKCDDAPEVEKITEYQYKQAYKATEEVYTCPTGYTKTGTGSNITCIKKDEDTKKIVKTVKVYCLNGENPDENGLCTSTNSKTTYVEPIVEEKTYCENGKTPTSKGCPVTTTKTTYVEPKVEKNTYCENGEIPTSKGCPVEEKETSYDKSLIKYRCTNGTLENSIYCKVASTISSYVSYELYKGKTYNGCTYSGSYTSSCGSYCTKTYYKYYCSKSSYTYENATPYCQNGSSVTSKGCPVTTTKTTYVEPIVKEKTYCENGENPTSKGCPVTTTKTTYVEPKVEKNTYCENGENPTSKGCPVTTKVSDSKKVAKSISYTCDQYKGYKKVGSGSSAVCVKENTTTVNPTTSKKEVTKYLYKWSKEEKLSGWIRTGKTREVNASSK